MRLLNRFLNVLRYKIFGSCLQVAWVCQPRLFQKTKLLNKQALELTRLVLYLIGHTLSDFLSKFKSVYNMWNSWTIRAATTIFTSRRKATIRPKRQFVPNSKKRQFVPSDNSSHFEKATIRPNYLKLQFVPNLIANKNLCNNKSRKITIRGRCQQLILTFHD